MLNFAISENVTPEDCQLSFFTNNFTPNENPIDIMCNSPDHVYPVAQGWKFSMDKEKSNGNQRPQEARKLALLGSCLGKAGKVTWLDSMSIFAL